MLMKVMVMKGPSQIKFLVIICQNSRRRYSGVSSCMLHCYYKCRNTFACEESVTTAVLDGQSVIELLQEQVVLSCFLLGRTIGHAYDCASSASVIQQCPKIDF